jgi:hypothetical protein
MTEPTTNAEKAAERATEARSAAGLPPRHRSQGPFAEMLAEAGFGAEAIRERGRNLCANLAPGTIGDGVIGAGDLAALAESFETVAAGLEAVA